MTPPIDARHHSSHRQLLTTVDGTASRLDAIIVPTNRTPDYLDTAMGLARELGCTLLLLCSQNASVERSESLAAQRGVDLIAVDVDRLPAGLMPSFRTSELLLANGFERRTDTSLKRNLGLLFSRAAGWERVVFLDDDIKVPTPSDLAVAAGLVDSYAGVGLAIGGFEDNSVVCHALREVGAFQDTFIGGGALAIGAHAMTSFFPNVYNEDWFFLLDDNGLRRTAMTGLAEQKTYDPFADPARARTEEFGDCLAEGLFALFDDGKGIRDADLAYWESFLQGRYRLIEGILDKVEHPLRSRERTRLMTASLNAARDRCLRIAPGLCVDYLAALAEDRITWHTFVLGQPVLDGPAAAMAALGLVGSHRQHPANSLVVEVGARARVHDLARV
ncbi:hypothetical protein [Umezawaea tangerina]|uniref:Glycosyl transferase family 2 n=1 Tax=Umezawaea tangerina TaxID=84725 RepID=A0A2T0SP67_9PSEU|nr:hypothetical protein [Umezawaea tangerina]PRY35197.1 hypothetical protein CLV43_114115 [Umezawaea tangerina]